MTDNISPTHNVIPETEFARRRRVHELVDQIMGKFSEMVPIVQELGSDLRVPTVDWMDLFRARLPEPMMKVLGIMPISYVAALIDLTVARVTGMSDEARQPLVERLGQELERMGINPEDGFEGGVRGGAMFALMHTPLFQSPSVMENDDGFAAARMRNLIARLFKEAPKLEHSDGTAVEGQAPALHCQAIMLRSGGMCTEGVLSTTPEGILRYLSANEIPDPSQPPPRPGMRPVMRQVMVEQFFDYADVVSIALVREVTGKPGSGLIS
jgi:hypothetical protein